MFRPAIADMQDKYCGDCYDIDFIRSQHKGNHKRGGAAECRAPFFVVAAEGRHLCILALNKVNILAVTTILVLHPSKTGRTVARTNFRLDGWWGGVAPDRFFPKQLQRFEGIAFFRLLPEAIKRFDHNSDETQFVLRTL